MAAPTDPAILRERLDELAGLSRAAGLGPSAPLSASPLPVAALQEHLGNATTWLGKVWATHMRGGAAVRRWLTSEPLRSPIPATEPRRSPVTQFRISLATTALGASVAAACYTLTAPLADPFFGLIPPDIFNRIPPFAEETAPTPRGGGPPLFAPDAAESPMVPIPPNTTGPPHAGVAPVADESAPAREPDTTPRRAQDSTPGTATDPASRQTPESTPTPNSTRTRAADGTAGTPGTSGTGEPGTGTSATGTRGTGDVTIPKTTPPQYGTGTTPQKPGWQNQIPDTTGTVPTQPPDTTATDPTTTTTVDPTPTTTATEPTETGPTETGPTRTHTETPTYTTHPKTDRDHQTGTGTR